MKNVAVHCWKWGLISFSSLLLIACQKPAEPPAASDAHAHSDADEHDHAHDSKAESGQAQHDDHAGEAKTGAEKPLDAGAASHGEAGHTDPESSRELLLDADALRDLRITTARAQKRPEQVPVSALGELRVDESRYAEVGAAIAGRVVKLLVSEGEMVKKGQVLAELESPEVGRARATLLQATARFSLAKRAHERKLTLQKEGSVSQRELDEAQGDLTIAEAELNAARATLAPLGSATQADGRFSLISPLAGQVLSRDLHLGELLTPEKAAFRVADLSHLWVVASVFERDAVHLAANGPAHILPTALPGQRLEARVAQVGAEVHPESRTVQIRLDLENPAGQTGQGILKPGMSANVQFFQASGRNTNSKQADGETPGVVTVPLAAVQRVEDHWVVFVPKGTAGKEGAQSRYDVRTIGRGRDLGGEVEVLSGLDAGTEVVVDGSFVLRASATQGDGGDAHHH